jgi:16S rRNA processing protein RimM
MLRKVTDKDLLPVAQVVKSYDTKGEVLIRLTSSVFEDYNFKEPVYLFFDGLPVPFFVVSYKEKGSSGALVKFETVNDLSHATEIIKKQIFVDKNSVEPEQLEQDDDSAMAAFLIGFELLNENGESVGSITDYYNYPGNPCIEINSDVLVPFNEELILGVDAKNKVMQMTIPNGLL